MSSATFRSGGIGTVSPDMMLTQWWKDSGKEDRTGPSINYGDMVADGKKHAAAGIEYLR